MWFDDVECVFRSPVMWAGSLSCRLLAGLLGSSLLSETSPELWP